MKNRTKIPTIYLGFILLVMYIPIFVVIFYSFNESRINSIWSGFSLTWYTALFNDRDIMQSLVNSVKLASISAVLSGIIGTMAAVGIPKAKFFATSALEYISNIPIMTPEIVMGILFLAFFSLLRLPFGMLTLIIAHTSFGIPYVYMMVKARVVGLDPSLVEAAKDLGAGEFRAFLDITLPSILPGVLSGMLLAFVMSMDDVVISIFVNGAKFNTLPVKIYTQLKTTVSPKINALCTLMFFGTIGIVFVASLISNIGVKKEQ